MNVIFAVVFATIAYKIGVPYTPTYIGATQPGSPAWIDAQNLPVGSRVVQVGREGKPREHLRFMQDFRQRVMLHGFETPLPMLIQPRDGSAPTWVEIQPEGKDIGMGFGKIATIGIQSMPDVRIGPDKQVIEGFPASQAETKLLAGDKIVAASVDGQSQPIEIYPDLHAFLAQHADDEVTLTIERTINPNTDKAKTETHTIHLARRPLRTLGVSMTMGPITALQGGSPAARGGLKKGDILQTIDGEKIVDPMLVPEILRRLANKQVVLTVLRPDGADRKSVEVHVVPREVSDYQSTLSPDEPVLVDALGITYRVDTKVTSVSPESDAHGELLPGDLVTHFQLVPAGKDDQERAANLKKLEDFRFSTKEVSLVDGKHDWPAAMGYVQWVPEGTQVKLTFTRGGKNETVVVTPYAEEGFYFAGRGLVLDQLNPIHTAESWGEAVRLGGRETWESLGLVVTFLKKLVTGRIALTSLGGPGTIAVAATSEASRGPAALLIFLTMLSANLAVVNFLPIPVLDGGHMMFLAYEGIFRRPVNEKWQIRLSLLGLSFVLCLMVFVIGLDFYRLSGLAQ
jgi:regulator of sigma E protease